MACRVGVAYRPGLAGWLKSRPPGVEIIEITAEDFFKGGERLLARLAVLWPLVAHTARLSLGTPGELSSWEVESVRQVVALADPLWICDHAGFRRAGGIDLDFPVPPPWTPDSLAVMTEHAAAARDLLGKPLVLENLASFLRPPADSASTEPDFLNRLCEGAGCGLLLDLTALVVNARNHGFDPARWLDALDHRHVAQVHVGGLGRHDGLWLDSHDRPVDDEVCALLARVLAAPGSDVRAVVLERDAGYPTAAEMEAELARLERVRSCAARDA